MNTQSSIAIACGDAKLSSLFFNTVIPLVDARSVPNEVKTKIDIKKLPPPPLNEIMFGVINPFSPNYRGIGVTEGVALIDNIWALRIQNKLAKDGIRSVPFFRDFEQFHKFLPKGHSDAIEVTLTKIGVIDESKLEWNQVLDLRKDKDNIVKLRRFRLFLAEKYKEADETYIQESLQNLIYEYEEACKKHGLDLKISTISKILDSNSLMASLTVATTAVLTGNPIVIGAGAVGAAIEIGKVGVHIIKKKLDFKSWKNNSEIAYLMAIKEKLK